MINRGFLCIGAVTCLCCSVQNCSAQINTDQDFKKLIFEKCWDAWASKIVKNMNTKGWYKNALYTKSIYEQIATAIADLMTSQNEFAPERTAKGFVEFEVTPFNATYERKHWNALVLYNCLYIAHRDKKMFSPILADNVGRSLKEKYKDIPGGDKQIDDAVADIKMYSKGLKMLDFVKRLRDWNENQDKVMIPCDVNIGYEIDGYHLFDPSTKSATFCISDAIVDIKNQATPTMVNIKIQDGKVVEYQTPYGVFSDMTPDMKLLKQRDGRQTHRIQYGDLTKSAEAQNIHSLYNEYTCHIDSLITALSMSDLFRQAIKKVSSMQEKYVQIGGQKIGLKVCKQIQKMIDGIDTGNMSKGGGGKCKQCYEEAYNGLTKALCMTGAAFHSHRDIKENMHNMGENYASWEENNKSEETKEFNRILEERKNNLSAQRNATLITYVCLELLQAIVYEFEQYGIQDVLQSDWVERQFYQKIGYKRGASQTVEVPACFQYRGADTWNGMSVQELILKGMKAQGDKVMENTYVQKSEGREERSETIITEDDQIRILPNVLCVITPKAGNVQCDLKLDDEFEIKDTQGKKKYRLVSTVMRLPNHFVARIKLKDGFYIVDDNRSDTDCAAEEGAYFRDYRNKVNKEYTLRDERDIHIAIYERCD